MKEQYQQQLTDLAQELVTEERFKEPKPREVGATVLRIYPELPEVERIYGEDPAA